MKAESSRRHRRFVEQVIYQGMKNLSPGADDDDGPTWLFPRKMPKKSFDDVSITEER